MYKNQEEIKENEDLVLTTAERIRAKREELGYTQEKMAEKAKLTVENYKKIEEGTNAMSMKSLRGVQRALEVPFDYLLLGETGDVKEIWERINACGIEIKVELLVRLIIQLTGKDISLQEVMSGIFRNIQSKAEDE